jgi:hypothetical protein
MPFLWEIPNDYPEEAIGEYVREVSPDRFLLRKACRLESSFGVATVRFEIGSEALRGFDHLPNSSMIPLVNLRLKSLIESVCPKDAEFFATKVITSDGELPGYSLLNVTWSVKATDMSQSSVVLIPGTRAIMKFNRLKFLEGCMGERLLARDSDYLSHLLVNESLAQRILSERISGVWLMSPEGVHP